MKKNFKDIINSEISYKNRILGSIAITELLVISIFTLWPVENKNGTYQDIKFTESEAVIEEVQITSQKNSPPPPPKPQVPIPVPNDEIIEEEVVTLEDFNISEYTDSLSVAGVGREGNSDQVASNPQLPPSVIRIVEPTVPDAAKKADIKAEIMVSFLVNKEGQVEEATISQIKLYDDSSGNYKTVDSINYGLTEATLEAALQWRFRPAKNQGEPVRAFTKHIFTYGF